MNDRDAQLVCGLRNDAGAGAVDCKAEVGLCFGSVNGGICSRIYHDGGREFGDRFLNQIGAPDIDVRARAEADLDIAASGGSFTKRARDLSLGTENIQSHVHSWLFRDLGVPRDTSLARDSTNRNAQYTSEPSF